MWRAQWKFEEKIEPQELYIQFNEIHNVVALIKFLLVLRCQLYMFRTATVHPQELLYSYSVCADYGKKRTIRYVQLDVSDSAFLTTYHSLHIQYLQRSS